MGSEAYEGGGVMSRRACTIGLMLKSYETWGVLRRAFGRPGSAKIPQVPLVVTPLVQVSCLLLLMKCGTLTPEVFMNVF